MDDAVLHMDAGGDGGERVGVALPVADLDVGRALRRWAGRDEDEGDDLVGFENCLEPGGGAGEAVEVGDRDLAAGVGLDDGVESDQRDRHVGRVGRDAGRAPAEDGELAVAAGNGGAAGAGLALVAGEGGVAEVQAAGALEQVAADGAEIAYLRRGGGEQRVRDGGPAAANRRVCGDCGHGGECGHAERAMLDGDLWSGRDVEAAQVVGVDDAVAQELDHVGAAGDDHAVRRAGLADGEGVHLSLARCRARARRADRRRRARRRRCWGRRRSGRDCRSSTRGSRWATPRVPPRSGRRRT